VLGVLLEWFFHGQPLYALVLGGVSLFVAGLCTLRVRVAEPHPAAQQAA
jgi:maltose/moltooligosaccharide transporter